MVIENLCDALFIRLEPGCCFMNYRGKFNLKSSVDRIISKMLKFIVEWISASRSVAHREAMTVNSKTIEKLDRSIGICHVMPAHISLQRESTNPQLPLDFGVWPLLRVGFQILTKSLTRRASPRFFARLRTLIFAGLVKNFVAAIETKEKLSRLILPH